MDDNHTEPRSTRFGHSHSYELESMRGNERRTYIVVAITAAMMVTEIVAGIAFGSMALLADGIHMASHAVALGISAFAYAYARRHANDPRFSFGTGKVNSVGGYTGAILLGLFALLMAWESVERLLNPVAIAFDQALVVAIVGLVVNAASALILGVHSHDHGHDHGGQPGDQPHDQGHHHQDHHHDHNLRAAYLHVIADALTSLTAIVALIIGKYTGALWVDPLMGIAGAVLVAKWSYGLLKQTLSVLLDQQQPHLAREIEESIGELEEVELADLHVWSVAPGTYAAIVAVVITADSGAAAVATAIRERLATHPELAHLSVDVRA